MSWLAGMRTRLSVGTPRTSPARLKLMVLLPLTVGLLVLATGVFATSMSRRIHVMYGAFTPQTEHLLNQLNVQVVLIAFIAAVLAFAIAFGVATPLKAVANRLEALKSGDLQSSLALASTPEVEWLAGAFNEALSSVNRYLFQSMTGAVLTLNAEGVVIGSSPAAEMILGYSEDEVVGRRFSEVFAPAGPGRAQLAAMESAIARRQAFTMDDVSIAAKDGRPVRIGVTVSYLRQAEPPEGPDGDGLPAGGEVVGVTIGFKDLGDIRRLRDHLRKADQLVALGTITAGVAHELRNPLASMRGLTELMGRDFAQDDPRRRYVATMLEAIDRLNDLVENLLLLSSDAGPGGERVEVAQLVREVANFVALGVGDRELAMEVDVDPEAESLAITVRRSRLVQALSNIMLNATQATPDGGTITLGVKAGRDAVVIRVHNTGSYIAPDTMKRLFVPFFTTKPNGTGLGLAIARQMVTAAGGRIDVDSAPDRGTAFTIELPVAGATALARDNADGNGQLTTVA